MFKCFLVFLFRFFRAFLKCFRAFTLDVGNVFEAFGGGVGLDVWGMFLELC